MSLAAWSGLYPDREPINGNWVSPRVRTGEGSFTKGVTNDRKSRKNARFQRIVSRKFTRREDKKPIELIIMVEHAYTELSAARNTVSDQPTKRNIKNFMQALRNDIRTHLESIHYSADDEKHKSELIAYNDFLYTFYINKADGVMLTEIELADIEEVMQRRILDRPAGATPLQLRQLDRDDKILRETKTNEARQRVAQDIIRVWCIQVRNYRAENPRVFLGIPYSAATLALCSRTLNMLPEVGEPAAAASIPAAGSGGPAGGSRTRKMKRS